MRFPVSNLSKSESFLITLFLAGILSLYQHFWQSPRTVAYKLVQDKILIARTNIEKNSAALKSISDRSPATDELLNSQKIFGRYLKSNENFSDVLTEIVKGSKGNAFNLTKILSENQTQAVGYTQTAFHLEAEASFLSIGKFLEKLEDSPILTEVKSIDILRLENEMEQCKVSIKLNSYVMGAGK